MIQKYFAAFVYFSTRVKKVREARVVFLAYVISAKMSKDVLTMKK